MDQLDDLLVDYWAIPVITRVYLTMCLATTALVQLDVLSPFQLYFNPMLIRQGQVWRLATTYLYFGQFGLNFLFNMTFAYRYSRMLEESSFRGRTADFFYMFLFGIVMTTGIAVFFTTLFLGHAFNIMMVYIWSRRNTGTRMNFFGLLNFQAPYLPFVLLAFSLLLGNPVLVDLMGIAVGHLYYFLVDVLPNQQGNLRLLQTPQFIKNLFNEDTVPQPYERPAEDVPDQDGAANPEPQPPPPRAQHPHPHQE